MEFCMEQQIEYVQMEKDMSQIMSQPMAQSFVMENLIADFTPTTDYSDEDDGCF